MAALRDRGTLVLVAPPGAGKTTRVPPALLAAGLLGSGTLWVLQPRRVAARAAARRIASELGEPAGERAGYQIRDEAVRSSRTRILVVTEGILTRRLLEDPSLPGHRGRDARRVPRAEPPRRPRPRDAPRGPRDPPRGSPASRRLRHARSGSRRRVPRGRAGPGAGPERPRAPLPRGGPALGPRRPEAPRGPRRVGREDRPLGRAREETSSSSSRAPSRSAGRGRPWSRWIDGRALDVRVLHGDLPGAAQDAALAPAAAGRRRVLLATNVAETSLTIEGVSTVVDSGLARTLRFDPRSGLDRLVLGRIPRASAEQRAGRAGRLGPGLALRLFSRHEEQGLRPFEEPELFRTDLASPLLDVLLWTARDPALFGWFERPPAASMSLALRLLRRLGAVEEGSYRPTPRGARMAALPVHPRLAALVLAGAERGLLREAATLAALVEERDVLAASRVFGGGAPDVDHASDLLLRLDLLDEAERSGLSRSRLSALGLDPGAALAVLRLRDLLLRRFPPATRPDRAPPKPTSSASSSPPTPIGSPGGGVRERRRRSSPGGRLSSSTPAARSVRPSSSPSIETSAAPVGPDRIRLASAVEREWLDALPGERVRTETVRSWDAASERVVARQRVVYDDLVLEEKEIPAPLDEETARLLLEAARADLSRALEPGAGVERLRARVAFLRRAMPELDLPPLDDEALARAPPRSRRRPPPPRPAARDAARAAPEGPARLARPAPPRRARARISPRAHRP